MTNEYYCSECQIEGQYFVPVKGYGQLCVICYALFDNLRFNPYWIKIQTDWLDSQCLDD